MIADAVSALVDHLTAAGIRCTDDQRDLDPPAVLVEPPVIRYRFGKAVADAEWQILAVVGASGRRAELVALSTLVESVRSAVGAVVEARPAGVYTTDSAVPLPAYLLTFTSTIGSKP
jgi:hypothetical protein